MSAKVKVLDTLATYTDGAWSCENKEIEKLLNLFIPDFSGADPNTDQTAAQYVADTYAGEIISVEEMPAIDGVIY